MTYRPGAMDHAHDHDHWTGAPAAGAPAKSPGRLGKGLAVLTVVPLGLLASLLTLGLVLPPVDPASIDEQPAAASVPSAPTPTPTTADSDSDGVNDTMDAYPADPARHSVTDRDGDGTLNDADVAPDDRTVQSWPTGLVTLVVDGDTIEVQGAGRVRLTGIDAPEVGECGHDEATAKLTGLIGGRQVTLVPGGRDDRDRYNRLLRYVDVTGADAGRQVIEAGLAIARYDSRDGYGAHPREAGYVASDAASPDKTCPAPPVVAAPAPAPAVTPKTPATPNPAATPKPAATPTPDQQAEPWNRPGPDLDCPDIGKKVRITGPDYHRLDADGDGWGCDSYG